MFPHEVASSIGLELCEDNGQSLISHVLQSTQHTSTEEHLAVAQTVLTGFELKGCNKEFSCLPAIHEASWDGFGSKDHIPGECSICSLVRHICTNFIHSTSLKRIIV